ncbi:Penicillopepsin-1 [Penicillium chermesinum]|nr:Penicillopepsin-1 [Penicillium chermesinum]
MVVFSKLTLAVAGLATMAAAAPAPAAKFSLEQVARPATKTNFAAKYAQALRKYHAEVPTNVQAAAAATGVATNTPEPQDSEYLTPVTVGHTVMNLDFDTGSADLWVFSNELPKSEQAGHAIYQTSSGTKKPGYSWSISYGDGSSASGDVYTDTVTVGGISVSNQAVEAASRISQEFTEDVNNDGLLGLAFSSINTVYPVPQKTWFDNAKSHLAQPLFGVALKHNAPGVYDFGFADSSKYTGELTYTEVDNSQGYWGFSVDSYQIGDQSGQGFSGIADTGTTLLLLDDEIVSAYYDQVPGATNDQSVGGYVFDCNTELPDFSVAIGDYTATVPGRLINYGDAGDGSGNCLGGIASNSGIGFSIFGDIFLKSQYVVFDASGPQLGFAPQA